MNTVIHWFRADLRLTDNPALTRATSIVGEAHWQSRLLDPASLPFDAAAVPDVFTAFARRQARWSTP